MITPSPFSRHGAETNAPHAPEVKVMWLAVRELACEFLARGTAACGPPELVEVRQRQVCAIEIVPARN